MGVAWLVMGFVILHLGSEQMVTARTRVGRLLAFIATPLTMATCWIGAINSWGM